jgi:hypothetical protein
LAPQSHGQQSDDAAHRHHAGKGDVAATATMLTAEGVATLTGR